LHPADATAEFFPLAGKGRNMKKKILFLRISYWYGAILDAVMLVPMLFSNIGGAIENRGTFVQSVLDIGNIFARGVFGKGQVCFGRSLISTVKDIHWTLGRF
jgi:hypothetical protein